MEVNYEPLSEPNTLYHNLTVDIKVLLGSLQKNQVTILYEEVKMAISIEFQKRITDLVDESNTKKSELPALMSVDYSSLSNALNYGIIPTPRILIRIANYFLSAAKRMLRFTK